MEPSFFPAGKEGGKHHGAAFFTVSIQHAATSRPPPNQKPGSPEPGQQPLGTDGHQPCGLKYEAAGLAQRPAEDGVRAIKAELADASPGALAPFLNASKAPA